MSALLLVSHGWSGRRHDLVTARPRPLAVLGILVLLAGACLWYWNAQGLQRMAAVLVGPTFESAASRMQEIEKMPESHRKDLSISLARAAFVSGGRLENIWTDGGGWTRFSPTADDLSRRDAQIKSISAIDSQRNQLVGEAKNSAKKSLQWLVSLFGAVSVSFLVGVFNRRAAARSQGNVPD